jgi:hypothetical protein
MTTRFRGAWKPAGRHSRVAQHSGPSENASAAPGPQLLKGSSPVIEPINFSSRRDPERSSTGSNQPRRSLGGLCMNSARPSHPELTEVISKDAGKPRLFLIPNDGEWNKENIPPTRLVFSSIANDRSRQSTVSAPPRFSTSVNDSSDSESDEEAGTSQTGTSQTYVRTITAFERDGKVILRFGKLTPRASALRPSSPSAPFKSPKSRKQGR